MLIFPILTDILSSGNLLLNYVGEEHLPVATCACHLSAIA